MDGFDGDDEVTIHVISRDTARRPSLDTVEIEDLTNISFGDYSINDYHASSLHRCDGNRRFESNYLAALTEGKSSSSHSH